jgi:hypothetical protein
MDGTAELGFECVKRELEETRASHQDTWVFEDVWRSEVYCIDATSAVSKTEIPYCAEVLPAVL